MDETGFRIAVVSLLIGKGATVKLRILHDSFFKEPR